MAPGGQSLAANSCTGVTGQISCCQTANCSNFIGNQNLRSVAAPSSCGDSKLLIQSGSATLGTSANWQLSTDVDAHSLIYYNWGLEDVGLASNTQGDQWTNFCGLAMLKAVTITVGSTTFEKMDRAAMMLIAMSEFSGPRFQAWMLGVGGGANRQAQKASGLFLSPMSGSAQMICGVKGTAAGAFIVASHPHQAVNIQIDFGTSAECVVATPLLGQPVTQVKIAKFDIHTRQHIFSSQERSLVQSSQVVQLHSVNQVFEYTVPGALGRGDSPIEFSLDHMNYHSSHIAVICVPPDNAQTAVGDSGGQGLCLGSHLRFLSGGGTAEMMYNSTSLCGPQDGDHLLYNTNSNITFSNGQTCGVLASEENGEARPNIYMIPLGQTAQTCTIQDTAGYGGYCTVGDGIPHMRFDNIRLQLKLGSTAPYAVSQSPFDQHTSASGGYGLTDVVPMGSKIYVAAFGNQMSVAAKGGMVLQK